MGQKLPQEYRLETKSNRDWELFYRLLCPESWEHRRLDAANLQNSTPHASKDRHAVTRLHQQGAALWILQLHLPKLLLNRFETALDNLRMETPECVAARPPVLAQDATVSVTGLISFSFA